MPAQINSQSVHGEEGTGYEDPMINGKDMGEFECDNCEYFSAATWGCRQKDMKRLSKRPRLPNGNVMVHPEGCCEYVERRGEKEMPEFLEKVLKEQEKKK